MLKLRCRNCGILIELQNNGDVTACGCGKCSLQLKDDRVLVGSENGIGGYILIKDDKEYIMIAGEELY